jgi:hypothetical protein
VGTPPDSVKRLVDLSACNAQADHFDQNRNVFLSPDYKEEQLRVSSGPSLSIRPSSFVIRTSPHESLGWDVSNKAGLTEVFNPATPAGRYGIRRSLMGTQTEQSFLASEVSR